MAEEPLYGLAVGAVTQFPRELENPGGAEGWHPDAAAAPVYLRVAILARRGADGGLS